MSNSIRKSKWKVVVVNRCWSDIDKCRNKRQGYGYRKWHHQWRWGDDHWRIHFDGSVKHSSKKINFYLKALSKKTLRWNWYDSLSRHFGDIISDLRIEEDKRIGVEAGRGRVKDERERAEITSNMYKTLSLSKLWSAKFCIKKYDLFHTRVNLHPVLKKKIWSLNTRISFYKEHQGNDENELCIIHHRSQSVVILRNGWS